MRKEQKKLKFAIWYQAEDRIQSTASQVLAADWQSVSKIDSLWLFNIWDGVKLLISSTDPHFSFDPLKNPTILFNYLYQNAHMLSLKTRPVLITDRLNLNVILDETEKHSPDIIVALDPVARDIALIVRRKLRKRIGVVALPPRLSLDAFWAGEEGDLWSVALPENREQLLAEFVSDKRIIVSGPLCGRSDLRPLGKAKCRQKLGWPATSFIVGLVALGMHPSQLEELLERICAFPDMKLAVAVVSQDKELRENIQKQSQGYLAKVLTVNPENKNSEILAALDVLIALQDAVFLPQLLVRQLPGIIMAPHSFYWSRDSELHLLAEKNLLWRAQNYRDVIWRIELILKDKKLLTPIRAEMRKIIPSPAPSEVVVGEIFARLKNS